MMILFCAVLIRLSGKAVAMSDDSWEIKELISIA